jgi:putative copper export protein/methionine-rich copper-binding protein CopC
MARTATSPSGGRPHLGSGWSRARRVGSVAAILALTTLASPLGAAGAAGAHREPAQTYPAANSVLERSPSQLALVAAEARSARVVLYDADHKPIAIGKPSRRGGRLVSDVPKLEPGVYTAVWQFGRTAGTHATSRSVAFSVAEHAASPALVRQAKPESSLNPAGRVIPRWAAFAAIMIFIGTLALRMLVTARSSGRAGSPETEGMLAATDRRLLLVAAVAIVVFIPATLVDLVNQATDKDAGLGFWQSLRPAAISDYLTGGPDGTLYEIRLALTALAALVIVPAACRALRPGWQYRARRVQRLMVAGLVLGTAELVVRVLPTEAPKPGVGWGREIFTRVLDWGHMYASAIWIGGLVALAVLGATLRAPAVKASGFWPIALRRFSAIATACVGVMILTGLWTAWLHLGPPRLLLHTMYGQTLLVKLLLVLILLGVAAANQLWLLPRVHAIRESGGGSMSSIVLRRFRKTVAAEAVLGLLILLVVPFLSGSARNQEFQAKAADLTQIRRSGEDTVRLRPSGAQPGMTDYDVWAPNAGGGVTIAFSSPQLGMPSTSVLATSLGGDRYRATGLYTPGAGVWEAKITTRHASFAPIDLGVTATPAEAAKAPTPMVSGSTWAWGLGELLAVVLALGGARAVSKRLTRRRRVVLAAESAS